MPNTIQEINLTIGPTTPKERPLAARRSFIRQTVKTPDTREVSEIECSGNEDAEPKTEATATSVKDTKLSLPPKKSLEEVEREVAEHTQKFDSTVARYVPSYTHHTLSFIIINNHVWTIHAPNTI